MANPSPTPRGSLQIRPLRDVTVRLARPHEWPTWDRLMNEPHYLGFQPAGAEIGYAPQVEPERFQLSGSHGEAVSPEGLGGARQQPATVWMGVPQRVPMRLLLRPHRPDAHLMQGNRAVRHFLRLTQIRLPFVQS